MCHLASAQATKQNAFIQDLSNNLLPGTTLDCSNYQVCKQNESFENVRLKVTRILGTIHSPQCTFDSPIGGRDIASLNFVVFVQWYRHLLISVAFQVKVHQFAPVGLSQNHHFVYEPGTS